MLKKILILTQFVFCSLFLLIEDAFTMHISDGILPMQWAGLWYLVVIPFLIKGLFDIKRKSNLIPHFKPLLGLMGAAVFIISCMPVPVPIVGTCAHPCGVAIAAILLGPAMGCFVASIALLLQALLLAHGGLTTLGANILSMGVAGSLAGYSVFRLFQKLKVPLPICGFVAGVVANWTCYAVTSFELALALNRGGSLLSLFCTILTAFIPTQLPLGILEGFMTAGMILFVARRRPDILAFLRVMAEKSAPTTTKGKVICIALLLSLIPFFAIECCAFAKEERWSGIDEIVVEKIAKEHGRKAWAPFINLDQGDLLLFFYLFVGAVGGFVLGINYYKLFGRGKNSYDKRTNE